MYYVHVNQHVIRSNINSENPQPPIAVKRGRTGRSEMVWSVRLPAGARVRSNPDGSPVLPCGARVVIECDTAPLIER